MGVKTTQYFILNCFVISSNIRESGIPVVCNATESSKAERGGLNFVDPEK